MTLGFAQVYRPTVTLVGHPFGPNGRNEHLRAIFRAFRSVGVTPTIFDWSDRAPVDDPGGEITSCLVHDLPGRFRIFHTNGAEVPQMMEVLERIEGKGFAEGHNIIFPAWELPRYPDAWARELDRFDEVWAASRFCYDSFRAAVKAPVHHVVNACEPHMHSRLERSHFNIPGHRFVVLFFFDALSWTARKNPLAVIEAFHGLLAQRPRADVHLVVKMHNTSHAPDVLASIRTLSEPFAERITIIEATLTSNEIANLIRCSDCFVSLHRSEGFGRGGAEAMFFGKPVIATGWSGNMQYMNPDVSFPVRFRLVPVQPGEYPEFQDQVWAEPDVGHATQLLMSLVDDPTLRRSIGERARTHMKRNYSDQLLGARYVRRLRRMMLWPWTRGSTRRPP
jgi:glycosyltransferase involved in cell wall biosynthesis